MSVPRPSIIYDPTVPNQAAPTPALEVIIRRLVKEGARNLRVCLPGQIVAVHNSYSVDVQPLLQSQQTITETPITLPILPGVPVSMPCGAAYKVIFPIAVGDQGMLIFADRSLDNWLSGTGGLADPQDARLHDLTDAIFVPGLLATSQQRAQADDTGDLVIQNGVGHIRVKKNGQVAIGNAVADLAKLVENLAIQLSALAKASILIPVDTLTSTAAVADASVVQAAASDIQAEAASITGS